jgi:hypothetical protein
MGDGTIADRCDPGRVLCILWVEAIFTGASAIAPIVRAACAQGDDVLVVPGTPSRYFIRAAVTLSATLQEQLGALLVTKLVAWFVAESVRGHAVTACSP